MRTSPRRLGPLATAALPAALALASGCSSELGTHLSGDVDHEAPQDDAGDDDDGDYTTLPPEAEDDFLALPPAQTDVYVFVANPSRDSLTRINARTLEVRTTNVGQEPTIVLTTPDYRWAVSFNRLDSSVSIVEAATLHRADVPVRPNFNRMKMSPDGTWVVLWHDVAAARPDDPAPGGLQSFNEASFVNLVTTEHFPMAVGFNPRDVVFTRDGLTAAVVSDEYLALVDLTADTPLPELIQLDEDLVEAPRAEEVVLSEDGTWAFIRQFGADSLLVVDLLARDVDHVPAGLNPTDLDLTPDGLHAVVVARQSRELWLYDAHDPFAPAEVRALPGSASLGSLTFTPGGEQAIVYTTTASTDRYATWERGTDTLTERRLVKPVRSLGITPTGTSMMVLHSRADAPDADTSSPFYDNWALTMVSLTDFRTNPLKLPAEPIGFANATNGRFGYFIMDGEPLLEVIDYETLLHEEITLRSEPVYVGVLPDLDLADGDEPAAWVSQEHVLGRLSFFDPDDGSVETITGFELNSVIEIED